MLKNLPFTQVLDICFCQVSISQYQLCVFYLNNTFRIHQYKLYSFSGGSPGSLVASPLVMIISLIFLNLLVRCLRNGYTYHTITNFNFGSKRVNLELYDGFTSVFEEKQKQLKTELYQKLLSYISLSSVSLIFARLVNRTGSKHLNDAKGLHNSKDGIEQDSEYRNEPDVNYTLIIRNR